MAPASYASPGPPGAAGHRPSQPHAARSHPQSHTRAVSQPQLAAGASIPTPLRHRAASKRGAMGNALADTVVPHHVHGPGGVHLVGAKPGDASPGIAGRGPGRAATAGSATAGYGAGPRIAHRTAPSGATLEDIARRVRAQSDRFQQVLLPAAEGVKTFAESSPVLFTFAAIFLVLSAIPLVIFIGFVTAVTVFSTGVSVIILSLSVAGTVMFGLTFLIPVLAITGTIATLSVLVLLGLFLAHRLYLHLSDAAAADAAGTDAGVPAVLVRGLASWWDETRARAGLGPYTYGVTAFEDASAYVSPGRPVRAAAAEPEQESHEPKAESTSDVSRIVYDQVDYSTHHPQLPPSFGAAAKGEPEPGPEVSGAAASLADMLDKKRLHAEPATPEGPASPAAQGTPPSNDTMVIKRTSYYTEWTSDDDSDSLSE